MSEDKEKLKKVLKTFWEYIEEIDFYWEQSCKDWTLWEPDFREVTLP